MKKTDLQLAPAFPPYFKRIYSCGSREERKRGRMSERWKEIAGGWQAAIIAALTAVVLIGLKLLVHLLGIEFVDLNALFTSIIAGGIFLFGVILAGTMSDYKESERIPAEIASGCESIYEDGIYVSRTREGFDLGALKSALREIINGFIQDASDDDSRRALTALGTLGPSFIKMEELGVPPNYIVRLKSEEAMMRKAILRMYYIQRTGFLPSAYFFIQSVVALILGLLVFVKIEPLYTAIIITVFLTYLFVYILGLLRVLDRPFRHGEHTRDDVSLFLLHELRDRLKAD